VVPAVIKRLISIVKMIKNRIGFKPRAINLKGIFEMIIRESRKPPARAKPINVFTRNKDTRKTRVPIIFVLGSSLCTADSPGKYCPNVISFIAI
jgi:hypothetical protein